MTKSVLLMLGSVLSVLAISGCGGKSVSASDVASQVKTQIGKLGTEPVKSASCPNDLNAKIGASENCVLTYVNGDRLQITVTVTSVSGSQAFFNMRVTKRLK